MKSNAVLVLLLCVSLPVSMTAQSPQPKVSAVIQASLKPASTYASGAASSGTFTHDGIQLYYEVYGEGEPLLLIHGNGGSIGDFKAQIEYFRKHYEVIAMDSRDHGRSGNSPDKITYEKMTGDLAALLDYLKTGPVNVLGWSDGGIEALELGIHYPDKVNKIAAMAANLEPDGATPDTLDLVRTMLASTPAAVKETPEGKRDLKVTQMLLDEPHIPPTALEKITAPTLILASDHDLIRDEHTLSIYHHIPNSELAIFPNATHMVPYDDPLLFNTTVERFFTTPYAKKDRIQDVVKSMQSLRASPN